MYLPAKNVYKFNLHKWNCCSKKAIMLNILTCTFEILSDLLFLLKKHGFRLFRIILFSFY